MSRARNAGRGRVVDLTRLTPEEVGLLNESAAEIRTAYNDLIARICSRYAGSLAWIFSSVTSRHTSQSATFLRCCQLALVRKIADAGEPLAEVVTDCAAMQAVLEGFFSKRGMA